MNIAKGIKLGWAVDAKVYDEQPVGFKQSWSQRERWTVGHIQCLKYYTKQYGEPIAKNSNYSDYYSVSECAYWSMDDGSRMELEYHSAAAYEPPSLSVYVYN